MFAIYDEANHLWLSGICCGLKWDVDVNAALTWESSCAATEAATAAGICACWVVKI